MHGIKDIKLYKSEDFYFKIFSSSNKELGSISAKTLTINQIPRLGIEIFLISLITIFILNMNNLGFDNQGSLELIGLVLVSFRMMPAASKFLVSMQVFRLHKASVDLLSHQINLKDTNEYNMNSISEIDLKIK